MYSDLIGRSVDNEEIQLFGAIESSFRFGLGCLLCLDRDEVEKSGGTAALQTLGSDGRMTLLHRLIPQRRDRKILLRLLCIHHLAVGSAS